MQTAMGKSDKMTDNQSILICDLLSKASEVKRLAEELDEDTSPRMKTYTLARLHLEIARLKGIFNLLTAGIDLAEEIADVLAEEMEGQGRLDDYED